jgi:hypothetical protein
MEKSKQSNVMLFFWISVAFGAVMTAVIGIFGYNLASVPHLPDQGPSWYYWKHAAPTFWTHFTAWAGYLSHQITVYIILAAYMIDKRKNKRAGINENLTKYNYAMLLANLFFTLLHFGQTHLFYDGLAQDVSVWSSQISVIIMLVLILVLQTPVRGLILGAKIPLPAREMRFLRMFHGIYIAWALVYTFWFHPMDAQHGLLTGFFYMFLLFIQLSLFDTKLHMKKEWIVLLESWVTLHGLSVAIMNNQSIWPMFLFGFLFMFFFTGIFALKIPKWLRITGISVFLAAAVTFYAVTGIGKIWQLFAIPAILYGSALVLMGIMKLISLVFPERKPAVK